MTDVLVLTESPQEYAAFIRSAETDGAQLYLADSVEAVDTAGLHAQVALAKPALLGQILPSMPYLRWAQSTFAGIDALLAPELPKGYLLTGVKGVFGPLMSEYVSAHIVARERGFDRLRDAQAEHRWAPGPYRGLSGLTLGVAGLGSIGRHIAQTGQHFGMTVLGYKRSPDSVAGVERVYSGDAFHAFLSKLDYLVLTLPGTAESHHLVDYAALQALPAHACLINVGRGSVIAEADLARGLAAGSPAAAVLDVFEQEPLPADSPLWTLPNCTITPHVAADSFPRDIARIFMRNWDLYQRGQALEHRIDFARGY